MRLALTLLTVAGATAAMLLTGTPPGAVAATPGHLRFHPAASPARDPVVAWNRILLGVLRTPGAQPTTVHATRSLAIVHAAIYDAAVAIDRRWSPYLAAEHAPRHASVAAAIDAAAHSSLIALYPALRPQLDDDYARALALIPGGTRRNQGIRIGAHAAARILAQRAGDGSSATPPPFTPGSQPGDYQPTPPALAAPVFTHWAAVTPFALERADQFRPPPPPALAGPAYADALNEVKRLGVAQGATRTPTKPRSRSSGPDRSGSRGTRSPTRPRSPSPGRWRPPPAPSRCSTSASPTAQSRCTTPSTPIASGAR